MTLPEPAMMRGDRAATSGSEPSAVWVVMATSGEWSDRSEWPICAYRDEASAQAKVDDSTARVRAAQARLPEAPEGGFGEDYDEKAWGLYNSEYAALLEKIADLGGSDFDLSFFVHEVPFGSPLQHSPAGSDGGGARVCEGCAGPLGIRDERQCADCREEERLRADEDWFFDMDGKP